MYLIQTLLIILAVTMIPAFLIAGAILFIKDVMRGE